MDAECNKEWNALCEDLRREDYDISDQDIFERGWQASVAHMQEQQKQAVAEAVERCVELLPIVRDNWCGDPGDCNFADAFRELLPHPDWLKNLLERERLKARLVALEQRANRWPPFGAIATVEARNKWIAERYQETMSWIAETKSQLTELEGKK